MHSPSILLGIKTSVLQKWFSKTINTAKFSMFEIKQKDGFNYIKDASMIYKMATNV